MCRQARSSCVVGSTTGTLILNSGTINFWTGGSGAVSGNAVIAIPNNDNNDNHASVYVNGGTLTLGNASYAAQIQMMSGGSSAVETGFLTQTGGVITAWGGIMFGGTNVNYSGGTAALTNSGGSLYIGQNGINFGRAYPRHKLHQPFRAALWAPWQIGVRPCQ